jgi:hypothetical protein
MVYPSAMAASPELAALTAAHRALEAKLVKSLTAKALRASAMKIGLWRKGALSLEDEGELVVLTDFALHHHRPDGKSLVERDLGRHAAELGPLDVEVLRALVRSRFTVLALGPSPDDSTVRARDLLYDEDVVVRDRTLASVATVGQVVAVRVVPFGDFAILAGAALPFASELAPDVRAVLERRWPGAVPAGLRALSPADHARVTADLLVLALRDPGKLRDAPLPDAASADA